MSDSVLFLVEAHNLHHRRLFNMLQLCDKYIPERHQRRGHSPRWQIIKTYGCPSPTTLKG